MNGVDVRRVAVVLATLLLVCAARADQSTSAKGSAPKADCAFSNAYYSGWCRVTVNIPEGATPQHACEVVLGCLNGENSSCQGNINPCQAPDVRSGWRLEESRVSKPQPTPRR